MKSSIFRFFAITVFLAGLVTLAILGTSATMTFVWPAYLALGAAGVAGLSVIIRKAKFALPISCVGMVIVATAYFLNRAAHSPVSYFGREDGALLASCFVVYLLFFSLCDSLRARKALFWCLAGILAANFAMGMIQLAFGPETWGLSRFARTYEDRIGGFFNHPEHFAGFMALGLPFLTASLLFGNHRREVRIALGVLSLSCLTGILLSRSLLGLLGTSAGCGVLLFFVVLFCWRRLEGEMRTAMTWALAVSLLFGAAFFTLNAGRIKAMAGKKLLSREETALVPAWRASLEQFSEFPWTGAGSRAFSFYSRKFLPVTSVPAVHEPEFVHNEYLQTLADYGLWGLALILGVVAAHLSFGLRFVFGHTSFQNARSTWLPRSDYLAWAAGAVASLVTISFLSFFDFVMHLPLIAVVASLFLGILACPDPMSRALISSGEEPVFPGGKLLFTARGLAFGGGLALCFFSFVYNKSEWHCEMAARSFEAGVVDGTQLKHLEAARRIDPGNPFAQSLSGHSYVRAIDENMAPAVRFAYLEKAAKHFAEALKIYPQDIYCALAHSVVLDELDRPAEAAQKLREAREWAPLYGNLMMAQAEHFARQGEYEKAERSFKMAAKATVFPGEEAARQGLALVERERNQQAAGKAPLLAGGDAAPSRSAPVKSAEVKEIEISGDLGSTLSHSISQLEKQLDAVLISPEPMTE